MPLAVLPDVSALPDASDFKPSLYTFDAELLLESLATLADGSGYYARVNGKDKNCEVEILKLDMGAGMKYSTLAYSSPKEAGQVGEIVAKAVAEGSETASGTISCDGNKITLSEKGVVLEVVDRGHLREWKSSEGVKWTEFYFFLGAKGSGSLETCGTRRWFERDLPTGGTTGLFLQHAHLFSVE
ncbi:unnamed protein product [Prorocentrum cordatum]|uniref:Beta-galactosidase n=1 Tax=Prorocentrum cordatum TaxID=2364126 RepID=A0ABN9RL72_9DINO|nr:unnamed protein product [Polarella glacialis]|mmetsp:Transcript_62881/g.169692  ORF Transcript_62881/g.169692 Transcript_62881/m.169692 type:complete len:185 (-) Transcript_62881:271-825(-)